MENLYHQNLKSSSVWTSADVGSTYLEKLLEEKKSLALYTQGFPLCNELLNKEILRVSEMIPCQGCNDFDRLQLGSPNLSNSFDMMPDLAALRLGPSDGNYCWSPLGPLDGDYGFPLGPLDGDYGLSPLQHKEFGGQQGSSSSSSLLTKKLLRLDVPVSSYPDFNFVGKLLGPRGNSLKRIEVRTGCRVFIRGRGSMKDPEREEQLRGKPGLGHLSEPLHVIIEAEAPANVVDAQLKQAQEIIEELLIPVSKSKDLYKRQQLRELAMLKSLFSEDKPSSVASSSRSGATRRASRKGTM